MTGSNTAHHCKYDMGRGKVLLAPMFCSTKTLQLEQDKTLRGCASSALRHFLLILPLCGWMEGSTSSHYTAIYYSDSDIR